MASLSASISSRNSVSPLADSAICCCPAQAPNAIPTNAAAIILPFIYLLSALKIRSAGGFSVKSSQRSAYSAEGPSLGSISSAS